MREKFVRTMVPVLVSLLASLNIHADETGLVATVVLPAVVGLGYYLLVRLVELKWPAFGVLLGIPKTPTYSQNDVLVAIMRTITPLLVAGLAHWGLEQRIGLSDETVLAAATAVITAGYYALAGWAETHWTWVGIFLGWANQPDYTLAA